MTRRVIAVAEAGTMQADLVRRAQSGDGEAFETLIRGAYDRLFATAHRILRDHYLAEDAAQEAIVHCWRDIRGLRDPDRFDAWLFRLLVNATRDSGRRHRRSPNTAAAIPTDVRAPGDAYAAVHEHDALDRAFRGLSTEHRIVLVLAHYVGYSAPEIATILGVPPGTVYSRLHYAARAMRAALAPTPPISVSTAESLR